MRLRHMFRCPVVCPALLAVSFFLATGWAQTEIPAHSFKGATDGADPYAGLIADSKGNGYGTTYAGGGSANCQSGCETVYKITSSAKETVLHAFTGGTTDGCYPYAPLVIDKSGNVYGTTSGCGANNTGIVFKISPSEIETILHNFGVAFLSGDGSYPRGGLALDARGNLYGTTTQGGVIPDLAGTIFRVSPSGTETVLYSFTGGADGGEPIAGPILDESRNLYGTTHVGGAHNEGTVFELSASGSLTVLYSFGGSTGDGLLPNAGVVLDKKGNLYGTTSLGGAAGVGTVYAMNPSSKTGKILHSFSAINGDGTEPYAGVVLDSAQANLYGATPLGGSFGVGTVYRLSLSGLKETVLHSFGATGDGSTPFGGVILDSKGNVYGTTSIGGKYNLGTVYRVVP